MNGLSVPILPQGVTELKYSVIETRFSLTWWATRTPRNLQNLGLITNHHGVWTAAWDQKYKERSREKVWSWKRQLPCPRLPFFKPWHGFFSSYCQHNWLSNCNVSKISKVPTEVSILSSCGIALPQRPGTAPSAPWQSELNQPWYRHGFQVSYFLFFLCLKLRSLKTSQELNSSPEAYNAAIETHQTRSGIGC